MYERMEHWSSCSVEMESPQAADSARQLFCVEPEAAIAA
jgi:hypothetical protein